MLNPRLVLLSASALVALAASPVAAAASGGGHRPTRAETKQALTEAQRMLAGHDITTGRELSPLLNRVQAGKSTLSASDQQAADEVSDRPASDRKTCTRDFCVHWSSTGPDAPAPAGDKNRNGIPDVVDSVASEMQNNVRAVENGTGAGQLGWKPPVSDIHVADNGGDARTDVYLVELSNPGGRSLYGYANPEDDPTLPADTSVLPSYLVLDNDFNPNDYKGQTAEKSRKATEAHEYNHIIQNAYDVNQDGWQAESTATWAEDKVFPDVNDYLNFYRDTSVGKGWGNCLAFPFTRYDAGGPCVLKQYGSAVFNHWLSNQFGNAVIRRAQEESAPHGFFGVGAYDAALRTATPRSTFVAEFGRFAATTAEWTTASKATPYPDRYPDLPRAGTLGNDGAAAPTQSLDNTTYRLFDVPVSGGKPLAHLHADLPPGLAGSVGLIGRKRDGTLGGATSQPNANGSADVTLARPGDYVRVTAVITNADATRVQDENGFYPYDPDNYQWFYARDNQPFCNVRVTSTTAGTGQARTCPAP